MVEKSPGQLDRAVQVAEAVGKQGPAAHVPVFGVGPVLQQRLRHLFSSLQEAGVQDVAHHGEAGVAMVVGCEVVTRVGGHKYPDQRGQGVKGGML